MYKILEFVVLSFVKCNPDIQWWHKFLTLSSWLYSCSWSQLSIHWTASMTHLSVSPTTACRADRVMYTGGRKPVHRRLYTIVLHNLCHCCFSSNALCTTHLIKPQYERVTISFYILLFSLTWDLPNFIFSFLFYLYICINKWSHETFT